MRIALVAALSSLVLGCNTSDSTTAGPFHRSSKLEQSHGEDAAAAFANLVDPCGSAESLLVTHVHCAEGNGVREGASIASSCAADRYRRRCSPARPCARQ